MLLRDLPPLLREEPGFASVLGRSSAVLAVPEPARALAIAGLATLSSRRPIVVAVPTTGDADRVANDLRAFLGADAVDTFPAWETLPFERVSPSVETMGRRLRTMWRLRDAERAPRVLVAPVRALVQRLGPARRGRRARRGRARASSATATSWSPRWSAPGYRREEVVEHRGELAVRGSIIDVYPSTADRPVRIDLWGDEVDRLTEFSVGDQRSTDDLARVEIFGCRELLPTAEVRERAERLIGLEPWGREQWERLAQGQTFDGMESWLPWLTEGEHVLFDLVGSDALVLLLEPRRMRDRAADLLAEEADLAATLAKTWGATEAGEDEGFPRLHLPFDRLLTHTDAPAWTVTTAPEGPDVATVASMGIAATAGDPERVVRQLAELAGDGYRIVVAADGEGSAARAAVAAVEPRPLADHRRHPARARLHPPGHQAGRDRRARPHRSPARPPRGPPSAVATPRASSTTSRPATTSCTTSTASPATAGMVKRAIGGVERDYLLLEYKGDDKLYVPSDQIDAVRHYTGGDSPTLNRLGGDGWQKAKAKVRSVVSEIAQELVVLYQKRLHAPGHAFAGRHAVAARARGRLPVPGDPRPAHRHHRGEGRHGGRPPDGPPRVRRRRASARPRWRSGPPSRRCRTASRSPCSCPPRCSPSSTTRPSATASPATRCGSRCCPGSSRPAQAREVARGRAQRRGRRRHRHPPAAVRGHRVQGPRPAGGRRGAALRRRPQGADQAAQDRRRRAHPVGHADPAHARDEPHRHPRPHAAQHAAGRPHADPHLRGGVRRPRRRRGHPPRAAARGPGVLRPQPGAGHRAHGRPRARPRARGAGRRRPRPDGRGHARAARAGVLGGRVRRARLHDDHRERHRHADGEHARGRPGRPARARPDAPAPRPRRALAGSGPTPTSSSRRTGCSARRPTSG